MYVGLAIVLIQTLPHLWQAAHNWIPSFTSCMQVATSARFKNCNSEVWTASEGWICLAPLAVYSGDGGNGCWEHTHSWKMGSSMTATHFPGGNHIHSQTSRTEGEALRTINGWAGNPVMKVMATGCVTHPSTPQFWSERSNVMETVPLPTPSLMTFWQLFLDGTGNPGRQTRLLLHLELQSKSCSLPSCSHGSLSPGQTIVMDSCDNPMW